MHRMRIFLTLSLCLFITLPAAAVTDLPDKIPEELLEQAETSYIFVFKDSLGTGEIRGLARHLAATNGGSLRHVYSKAIQGFSASLTAKAAAAIATNPNIAYYETNGIVWAADKPDVPQTLPLPSHDDVDDGESLQIIPWGWLFRILQPVPQVPQ